MSTDSLSSTHKNEEFSSTWKNPFEQNIEENQLSQSNRWELSTEITATEQNQNFCVPSVEFNNPFLTSESVEQNASTIPFYIPRDSSANESHVPATHEEPNQTESTKQTAEPEKSSNHDQSRKKGGFLTLRRKQNSEDKERRKVRSFSLNRTFFPTVFLGNFLVVVLDNFFKSRQK